VKTVQDDVKVDLTSWCNSIETKLVNLDKKQNKILEATVSISEQAEGLQVMAKEIESYVGKVTTATNKLTSNTTPYWDALIEGQGRMEGENTNGKVIYDIKRKAKQILIDFKDSEMAMTSTDTLIKKANGIIVSINDNNWPEMAKVEMITRFPKGGTLLQLNSKEAACWLREPGVKEIFLQKFAKNAIVRERSHHILLYGVSITFNPANETHLQEIEEANGLVKYSFLKARWIKPEGRRWRGQMHAYATTTIALAETPNHLIGDGLHICGVDIRLERLRQKPF